MPSTKKPIPQLGHLFIAVRQAIETEEVYLQDKVLRVQDLADTTNKREAQCTQMNMDLMMRFKMGS